MSRVNDSDTDVTDENQVTQVRSADEAAPEEQPIKIGDTVGGRFKILSRLGSGGMGDVFVAENLAIEMKVAVKMLRPELTADVALRRRLHNEARAIAAIQHPGVARFYDLIVDGPTFLVMEYVPGPSLGQVIAQEGTLSQERALAIAHQLCKALSAVHASGVVHRDLKPDNIVITKDAEHDLLAKVIDFGVAKLDERRRGSAITEVGKSVGTPEYMAPEQIAGEAIDPRVDVYALGCVLYHMLTGRPPFSSRNEVNTLYQQLNAQPPDIGERSGVAPAVVALTRRALEKLPGERFQNMVEFAQAIDRARAGTSGPAITRPEIPSQKERQSRDRRPARRAWLLASLAVVGVVGALVIWTLLEQRRFPQRLSAQSLWLISRPAGARVLVDGIPVEGRSPCAQVVSAGRHTVRFEKDGLQPVERTVNFVVGQPLVVDVAMEHTSRQVSVTTLPAGASVFLDGQLIRGTTPTTTSLVDDDFHLLRFEKLGFETLAVSLKPEDHRTALIYPLEPEKLPRGELYVDSLVPAEVWIDGLNTGVYAPTLGILLSAGEHRVELRLPDGARSLPFTIRLEKGETRRLTLPPPSPNHGEIP